MSETIRYSVGEDGIALLVVDLPGRSMNVLTPAFMAELEECIAKVADDEAVQGAVVTSGKSSFIAGADLKELAGVCAGGMPRDTLHAFAGSYSKLYRRLETCGKPFVAAINGTALGGGLELCLACHYRVALDDPKTRLGLPEVQLGLLPGAGGTQRLPRMIGIEKALPLLVEGSHFDPAKAQELGIVEELAVDGTALIEAARRWILDRGDPVQRWDRKEFRFPGGAGASRPATAQAFMVGTALVAQKTQHNYPAPVSILSCVYEGSVVPIDRGLDIEGQYFVELLSGTVARNMIRTLFIDKGAADKLKARPPAPAKSPVAKLGILGAGMMGAGIAYVSACAGIEVVLLDTDQAKAEQGKARSLGLLQEQMGRGRMTPGQAERILGRILPTSDYAQLAGCELVVEAVFEDRDLKRQVTQAAEAVIPDTAIFASNTSTLPISGLAAASRRPEAFIGLHFFSPVERMPLVEIIVGERSGETAIARALDFVQQLRKTPIVVHDGRGFYTSRVFGTFVKEGMAMLAEGVKPALIENAAKMAGMPVGPLAIADELTLKLNYRILQQARQDLGEACIAHPADEVITRFHDDFRRLGKRHGAGFYDYPEDGRKRLWPELAEQFRPTARQPGVESVKQRLLFIQSLETARCLEEGVVTDLADADLGSVLGWGFPAWTGGTASLMDTVGVAAFVAECDRMAGAIGERFRVPDWLRSRTHLR